MYERRTADPKALAPPWGEGPQGQGGRMSAARMTAGNLYAISFRTSILPWAAHGATEGPERPGPDTPLP